MTEQAQKIETEILQQELIEIDPQKIICLELFSREEFRYLRLRSETQSTGFSIYSYVDNIPYFPDLFISLAFQFFELADSFENSLPKSLTFSYDELSLITSVELKEDIYVFTITYRHKNNYPPYSLIALHTSNKENLYNLLTDLSKAFLSIGNYSGN